MLNNVAHFISHIRPGGGPKGYLYNLYQSSGEKNYDIIYERLSDERDNDTLKSVSKLDVVKIKAKRFLESILPSSFIAKFFIPKVYSRDLSFSQDIINKLHCYKVIVFHNLIEFSYWNKYHKNKEQICLVFSHCPTDFTHEYILTNNENHWSTSIKKLMCNKLLELELEQYKNSDGLICPTEFALDGYFKDYPEYRKEFDSIKKYEIVSGVKKLKKEIQNKNELKVTYLGRYHESKGFDMYLEASDLSKATIKWQCGGFGHLENEIIKYNKVVNLGWISNVEKVFANSAVIVIPNRETYFDLVLLEALSLGKPVVTTYTGGNKIFNSSKSFIICEPTSKAIAESVDEILSYNQQGYSEENEKLYDHEFSLEVFAKRHIALATKLKLDFCNE